MEALFHQELEGLNDEVLRMRARAERLLSVAVTAFLGRDERMAAGLQAENRTIDQMEIDIDARATGLLLKAPVARDLRFVLTCMRINKNLEWVTDEARKIARHAIHLALQDPSAPLVDIPVFVGQVTAHLKPLLDCLARKDPEAAR